MDWHSRGGEEIVVVVTIFYWLFGSLEGDVVGLAKVHNTVDEGVYLFEAGDTAVQ